MGNGGGASGGVGCGGVGDGRGKTEVRTEGGEDKGKKTRRILTGGNRGGTEEEEDFEMSSESPNRERPLADINDWVCAKCLHVDMEKREIGGRNSFFWLLPVIGAFFLAWTWSKARACPACGEKSFIPVNTRRGLALVELEKESFGSKCKRFGPLVFAIIFIAGAIWLSLWQTGHQLR